MNRRYFMKIGAGGGAFFLLPGKQLLSKTLFAPIVAGLNDPNGEDLFMNIVPNALDPGFIFSPIGNGPNKKYNVAIHPFVHNMGFKDLGNGPRLTPMFGYGDNDQTSATYPGKTFVAQSGTPVSVKWKNKLDLVTQHLLPVDTSLHWCYSLPNYTQYSIQTDGIPIVPHLHGGHTESESDGNPEFFFSPGYMVRGPQWIKKDYNYDNDQQAGTLWYHDHALGITRLNVYAGMAGFYILRDSVDTGLAGNTFGLPVYPYEAAFAIQDKMFNADGTLFWPSFPGDPFYEDFIVGEGANLPVDLFPGGGPTALAEFFGDHMIVNGKLWPKMDVEPRNYRFRYLNGCDSRFLVVELWEVDANATQVDELTDTKITFTVIGSDQGLAAQATDMDRLVIEPGSRYDIVVNFAGRDGKRIIMKNIGGDTPFGFSYGEDLEAEDIFAADRRTDRIMAFDVSLGLGALGGPADVWNAANLSTTGGVITEAATRVRKLGLFEGKDEFGRLQPILGTAEPATDHAGLPIYWPETQPYIDAGLAYEADGITRRQMEGAIAWHSPTTENPELNDVEEWHLFNVTGDSHPIHLHQVHFEVVRRQEIVWDSKTIGPDDPSGEEEDRVIPNALYSEAEGDGTYLVAQTVVQHNSGTSGLTGGAFRIVKPTYGMTLSMQNEPYVENTPKDMVTARPGEITVIKAKFDRPGRYVWHCHILSHEDHEMMRVLHVGALPAPAPRLAMKTEASLSNYPNPFRDKTTFQMQIPDKGKASLRILDLQGREVHTLQRGTLASGEHLVKWDGNTSGGLTVPAGMYICQLILDGKVHATRKLQKI